MVDKPSDGNIVNVNVADVLDPAQIEAMGKQALQAVLQSAIDVAEATWQTLARERLHTSQLMYTQAIQRPEVSEGMASVSLVGEVANAIENDQKSYDMHDTLLGPSVPVVPLGGRGKHAKDDGSGFYRAIPFRHGGPGTVGAVGAPMGSAYKGHSEVEDAKALGMKIYAAAKSLKGTTKTTAKKTNWGERLKAGLAPKLRPHHATDIYAGMVRQRKTYAAATQSTYMTFRTISTNSPGWVRKATKGANIVRDVQKHVESVLPTLAQNILKGTFK